MNRETLRKSHRKLFTATLGCLVAFLLGPHPTAQAELAVGVEESDAGTLLVYRMTVTPAPEPIPPLRHRLAVREIELMPGNAATHYLRAFPESGFESRVKSLVDQHGEEFYDWINSSEIPLTEFPLEKAREAVASFDSVVDHFIAPASLRRECDWGLGIEEMRGPTIIQMLLPEFTASRTVSRVLALRARVAIAEGDYDRAIDQLRMNYRLARNVGRVPFLICGLIGIAEANLGHQQVIELLAAKDSPNLYWALAELPQPLVDIRRAVQFEMSLGVRIFPFLIDAETASHSPEEWARILANGLSEFGQLTSEGSNNFNLASLEARQAAVAGMSIFFYPGAKQRLIAGGMAAEQVEAMPVGQVVVVDAAREYRRVADEIEKWAYVPYYLARQRDSTELFDAHGATGVATRGYGYVLAALLLPAVEAARAAEARLDWQTRALQIIEAIRMHAAQAGTLPSSLDEIKVVPLPLNPATNQAYQYRLEGATGVLELPFQDGFTGVAYRFEITLSDGN